MNNIFTILYYFDHHLSQEKNYAQPLVNFTMGIVEKYSGKRDSVVNFGSGTGITSFLLSKDFEKVTHFGTVEINVGTGSDYTSAHTDKHAYTYECMNANAHTHSLHLLSLLGCWCGVLWSFR